MLPPEEFRTIKQPKGSRICTACVTAMALNTTLEYIESRMEPSQCGDGEIYYKTREMLKVLGAHGIYCGLIFSHDESPVESFRLATDLDLQGLRAILVVRSENIPGASHFIFWDGERARDPLPGVRDTKDLSRYHVQDIIPLVYLDESQESFDLVA